MLWAYGAIALLAAFLAWLVVAMFMTREGERKSGASLVGLLVFGAVCGVGMSTVMPRVKLHLAKQRIAQNLSSSTPYAELKQYDPLAYNNLLNQLQQLLREGRTEQEALADATGLTLAMLRTKVAQGSDEAAVSYMQAFSSILDKARERDPEACSALAKPDAKTTGLIKTHATPEQMKQLGAAMGKIFASAATEPQVAPAEIDVKPQIEAALTQLVELYGRDVLALADPAAARAASLAAGAVSASRKCQMEAALLRLILRQPPDQAGKLVRYLVSKG